MTFMAKQGRGALVLLNATKPRAALPAAFTCRCEGCITQQRLDPARSLLPVALCREAQRLLVLLHLRAASPRAVPSVSRRDACWACCTAPRLRQLTRRAS